MIQGELWNQLSWLVIGLNSSRKLGETCRTHTELSHLSGEGAGVLYTYSMESELKGNQGQVQCPGTSGLKAGGAGEPSGRRKSDRAHRGTTTRP